MNQLNLALDYTYPDCLILKIKDEEFLITNPDIIKNIAIKRKKIVIEWWMVNVLSQIESDSEHFIRLDEKIDEEMFEVEVEMESFQYCNKSALEWEIADVLEVTQAIKVITRNLTILTSDQEIILDAAINTRKYILGIVDEYNLKIRDVIQVKKVKYKKKWGFKKWYIWWGVTYDELETQEWKSKLLELLAR